MSDLRLRFLVPAALWLLTAVAARRAESTLDPLPAVALGSTVLLHALRAGALFAVGFVLATVLARTSAGRLPTQLSTSGIGCAAEETRATATAVTELQEQVDDHEAMLQRLAERLDALHRTSLVLEADMAAHPTRQPTPTASQLVREMRERNAPRRERVLCSIQRLREIADAKRRRRR